MQSPVCSTAGGLRFTGTVTSEIPHGLLAADGSPIVWPIAEETLVRKLSVPSQGRIYYVRYALRMGWTIERIHELTRIDPWFLDQFASLVEFEDRLCQYETLDEVPPDVLLEAKFSELAIKRFEYTSIIKREGFDSLLLKLENKIAKIKGESGVIRKK